MQKDPYYDNTRITEFRTCPRKFYFRHSRDLVRKGFSAPLVFGSAWHEAMDIVWKCLAGNRSDFSNGVQNLNDSDVVNLAYDAFVASWIADGGTDPMNMSPEEIQQLGARTPFVGKEMLYEYVIQRRGFLEKVELVAVEEPFAVPLDPANSDLFYVGRLDKVFRKGKDIIVGEHKTTSLYKVGGPFRATFIDQFSPNSQVDGYLHAIHMKYGEAAKAVWVDGSLVHKKVHDGFVWIPIERQHNMLDAWLWETLYWIKLIEENRAAIEQPGAAEQPFMAAFPKNTNACQDFARNCPFIDLCKAWPNPLAKADPPDFDKEPWSPFDRLMLEKLGMENPDA